MYSSVNEIMRSSVVLVVFPTLRKWGSSTNLERNLSATFWLGIAAVDRLELNVLKLHGIGHLHPSISPLLILTVEKKKCWGYVKYVFYSVVKGKAKDCNKQKQ